MPVKSLVRAVAQPTVEAMTGYEPPATVACQATTYDGSSYYTTTDSAMIEGGDFTWCCEAYVNSTPTDLMGLMGDTIPGTSGAQILWVPGTGKMNFGGNNGTNNALFDYASKLDGWATIVCVHARGGGQNEANIYVDGVQGSADPLTASSSVSTSFRLGTGPDAPTRELYGKLRNVEIYSGIATNPTEWVPGNTSSLTGTTLKFQSEEGNSTNDQSVGSWTTTGTPVTADC